MEFRELQQKDITYMSRHSRDKDYYKKPVVQTDFCWALEHENKTLCIGGIKLINDTTAWAWIDLSEACEKHIITCYRTIKEWSDMFCKQQGIKRLEAFVEVGFEKGIRTVEHLGFKFEYRKSKFFGDRPADVFVKFYNGE